MKRKMREKMEKILLSFMITICIILSLNTTLAASATAISSEKGVTLKYISGFTESCTSTIARALNSEEIESCLDTIGQEHRPVIMTFSRLGEENGSAGMRIINQVIINDKGKIIDGIISFPEKGKSKREGHIGNLIASLSKESFTLTNAEIDFKNKKITVNQDGEFAVRATVDQRYSSFRTESNKLTVSYANILSLSLNKASIAYNYVWNFADFTERFNKRYFMTLHPNVALKDNYCILNGNFGVKEVSGTTTKEKVKLQNNNWNFCRETWSFLMPDGQEKALCAITVGNTYCTIASGTPNADSWIKFEDKVMMTSGSPEGDFNILLPISLEDAKTKIKISA